MEDDIAFMFGLTWIQDERKQQVGLPVDFVAGFLMLCRNSTDCSCDTDPLLEKGVLMGKCKTIRRTEDSTQAPNFNRCSRIVETCARRKRVCRAFKRNS